MPSRASTSLLRPLVKKTNKLIFKCQCPLGLVPHCYRLACQEETTFISCQCPLGLVPHCYHGKHSALPEKFRMVSMPSRASTSLLLGESKGIDH